LKTKLQVQLSNEKTKNEEPSDNADLGFQSVGPALRIMQLNVEGLSAEKRHIIRIREEEDGKTYNKAVMNIFIHTKNGSRNKRRKKYRQQTKKQRCDLTNLT